MANDSMRRVAATQMTLCAVFLGRLQVGLTRGDPDALRIFAIRLVRETLVCALRREGHQFTEARFCLWFSGLHTLADFSETGLRPPRALCHAILTEFGHSSWDMLVTAAAALERAFLAPSDFAGGQDHEEANAVIAEARALIKALDLSPVPDALPFTPLTQLFAAASGTARFARGERSLKLVAGKAIEHRQPGNAAWALDILSGELLAPRYGLPIAIPMPDLVALAEPPLPDGTVLSATYDAFARLDRWLSAAERDCRIIRERLTGRRSSGRARPLAEYLVGFGPMSGKQIAQVLGATRMGVDVMASTLEAAGLLARTSRPNMPRTFRHTLDAPAPGTTAPVRPAQAPEEQSAALREYEDAMREIDALLNRSAAGTPGD